MLKRAILGVILALSLTTGSLNAQRTHFYSLQEFIPTAFHSTIYYMMESCTEVKGDYTAVRWYIASTIAQENDDGKQIEYRGLWFKEWGWPAIILDRQEAFSGYTVSHEIMHDLYKGQGPMDMYAKCVLDWANMRPLNREEQNEEDEKDGGY